MARHVPLAHCASSVHRSSQMQRPLFILRVPLIEGFSGRLFCFGLSTCGASFCLLEKKSSRRVACRLLLPATSFQVKVSHLSVIFTQRGKAKEAKPPWHKEHSWSYIPRVALSGTSCVRLDFSSLCFEPSSPCDQKKASKHEQARAWHKKILSGSQARAKVHKQANKGGLHSPSWPPCVADELVVAATTGIYIEILTRRNFAGSREGSQ